MSQCRREKVERASSLKRKYIVLRVSVTVSQCRTEKVERAPSLKMKYIVLRVSVTVSVSQRKSKESSISGNEIFPLAEKKPRELLVSLVLLVVF